MANQRQMHLALFWLGTGNHSAGWRMPNANFSNSEWSFVETQRHLLFARVAWLGNAVLEEETPYRLLGFLDGGMPPDAAARLGLTL